MTITVNINGKSGKQNFEKVLGEYLENELSKSGFSVSLPSFTDWGYAFRTKYGKHEFDIVIQRAGISNHTITISIASTLNRFQRLLSISDTDECHALSNTVESLLKNDVIQTLFHNAAH